MGEIRLCCVWAASERPLAWTAAATAAALASSCRQSRHKCLGECGHGLVTGRYSWHKLTLGSCLFGQVLGGLRCCFSGLSKSSRFLGVFLVRGVVPLQTGVTSAAALGRLTEPLLTYNTVWQGPLKGGAQREVCDTSTHWGSGSRHLRPPAGLPYKVSPEIAS